MFQSDFSLKQMPIPLGNVILLSLLRVCSHQRRPFHLFDCLGRGLFLIMPGQEVFSSLYSQNVFTVHLHSILKLSAFFISQTLQSLLCAELELRVQLCVRSHCYLHTVHPAYTRLLVAIRRASQAKVGCFLFNFFSFL